MQKAVIRKLFLISQLSDVNAVGNNIRALYFSEMCSL